MLMMTIRFAAPHQPSSGRAPVHKKSKRYKIYIDVSYLLTYLLTDLLTPWRRVLLEELTGFQQVKKFPAFYGTRRFITVFTSAHHLSLS